MNKIIKLSLSLSLLISVYSCAARLGPSSVNVPTTTQSSNPDNQSPNDINTGSNGNSNNPKPYSRPKNTINSVNASSSPFPQATASSTVNTQPSGDTGNTSDVKERATFNGNVLDRNGNPVDGATVTARSIDSGVNWAGETQVTVGGVYVFRNAPSGARIEITVTKDGVSKTRSEVLKSNLTGDPYANVFDFSSTYSLDNTLLKIYVFDGQNQPVNNSNIKIESLDPSFSFSKEYTLKNNHLLIMNSQETIPVNTKFKITVNANNKVKEREIVTAPSQFYNEIKFGGENAEDKPFAIAAIKESELDSSINRFINASLQKQSTFSVDTDTASYTLMRDSVLRGGSLPGKESVRIEEYINYFDYNYPKPQTGKFSINTEIAASPFDKTGTKHILRIGIQGQEIKTQIRKDSMLTFLIDTSGSMADNNKLNLVKNSLKIMLKQLKPTDKVAIVEYNFGAKTVLKHTFAREESKIVQAIDSLKAVSTTDIEKGLKQAFNEAQEAYDADYLNRIILCSDGINSTAIPNIDDLIKRVKEGVEVKISVSSMGVGFKDYNDAFLENIASKNDGYYSYIDNVKEAVRLFVENATDTLQVIAKDAKIQIEFNPATVVKYRLIGYDNKVLSNSDFRNDNVDAGEIGSNHSVTALYEIELNSNKGKIADISMRYKDVENNNNPIEITKEILNSDVKASYESSSQSFKTAALIALYGEILRKSYWSGDNTLDDVLRYSTMISKDDKLNEFITIVEKAKSFSVNQNINNVTPNNNNATINERATFR